MCLVYGVPLTQLYIVAAVLSLCVIGLSGYLIWGTYQSEFNDSTSGSSTQSDSEPEETLDDDTINTSEWETFTFDSPHTFVPADNWTSMTPSEDMIPPEETISVLISFQYPEMWILSENGIDFTDDSGKKVLLLNPPGPIVLGGQTCFQDHPDSYTGLSGISTDLVSQEPFVFQQTSGILRTELWTGGEPDPDERSSQPQYTYSYCFTKDDYAYVITFLDTGATTTGIPSEIMEAVAQSFNFINNQNNVSSQSFSFSISSPVTDGETTVTGSMPLTASLIPFYSGIDGQSGKIEATNFTLTFLEFYEATSTAYGSYQIVENPFLGNLLRVQSRNTDNPNYYFYVSAQGFSDDEQCLQYETLIDPPCGINNYIGGGDIISITCSTTSSEGVELCDSVMKTVNIEQTQ